MLQVIVQAGERYLRYSSCDATEVEAAGQDLERAYYMLC